MIYTPNYDAYRRDDNKRSVLVENRRGSTIYDDRRSVRVSDVDDFLGKASKLGYRAVPTHGHSGSYTFENSLRRTDAALMLIDGTWLLFNGSKTLMAIC